MPTCALCRCVVPQLIKSHILPSFAYRRVRDLETDARPDPISLTATATVRTSRQLQQPLLCPGCEHRFKVGGEDYVASVAYQENGEASIFNLLGHSSAVHSLPHLQRPLMLDASSLETNKLAYFAISIFWRVSVSTLPQCGSYKLAAAHEERFRRFLLGEEGYPAEATMLLVVIDQARHLVKRFDRAMTVPMLGAGGDGGDRHVFQVNGLFYRMTLTDSPKAVAFDPDICRGRPPMVRLAAANHIEEVHHMAQIASRSPRRGSFATEPT